MIVRCEFFRALCGLLVCLALHSFSSAQTVQLPTTRQFWSTGAVLVPDRGGASSAGIGSRSSSGSARALPLIGNSGFRPSLSGGHRGTSVHATIIDLDAMDRAVLAAARKNRNTIESPNRNRARFIAKNVFRHRPVGSRAKSPTLDQNAKKRIAAMIEKAKQAKLDGKPKIAKMFYRVAEQIRSDQQRR